MAKIVQKLVAISDIKHRSCLKLTFVENVFLHTLERTDGIKSNVIKVTNKLKDLLFPILPGITIMHPLRAFTGPNT